VFLNSAGEEKLEGKLVVLKCTSDDVNVSPTKLVQQLAVETGVHAIDKRYESPAVWHF
jgi:hypothetical protein